MKVTVIIPCWRRADLLRVCLESLAGQMEQRFQVLVVSSGGGGEVAAVAREFATALDCRLLELPENRGFAAAVNVGLGEADTEYLAVLNDDVRLDPAWLATLTGWLDQHPETGFCAGTIYSGDGTLVDNLGDALSRGGAAWRLGHGLKAEAAEAAADHTARPLLAASWTAVLLRREVVAAVGKLDEQFISYLEDIDFAVRCVRANVRGVFLPQAVCWHHGGASSGGGNSGFVFRQMTRNRKLLLAKTFPGALRAELKPEISSASWLWLGMALRQGQFLAWLAGQLEYWSVLIPASRSRLKWDAEAVARLRKWLLDCEELIYADQYSPARGKPDNFWRGYFALAGKPSAVAAHLARAAAAPETTTRQP